MRALLITILVAGPLMAQSYQSGITADSWYVRNLDDLKERLAKQHGAALVVVDLADDAAEAALRNLLADERLIPLRIRPLALSPSENLGKAFCAQQNWDGKSPRWAVVDPKGIAVAQGRGLPTVAEVLKAFESTGCRPRLEVLRRMAEEHPDHLEAAQALLHELRRIGETRTYRTLNRELPVPSVSRKRVGAGSMQVDGREDEPDERPLPALSDKEDEACWDEYARVLQRVLPDLLPLSPLLPFGPSELLPRCIPSSARLQEAARRLLPDVERWMERNPSSERLWELWIALRGDRSIQEVLSGLTPDPFTAPGNWPPPAAQAAYVQDCRARKDWKGLLELAEPAWKGMTEGFKTLGSPAHGRDWALVPGTWAGLAEPLLEALLRTQRTLEAQALMDLWMTNSSYKGAAARAAALARACGEEGLAEKWGKAKG